MRRPAGKKQKSKGKVRSLASGGSMSLGTRLKRLILIRTADAKTEPVKEWLERNSARNEYDPAVLGYPGTTVLAAHTNGKVHVYMPIQPVAMLESVGFNPESTQQEIAESMVDLVKASALLASNGSIRELYFLATDESTANGARLMGFEKLDWPVFRLRLGGAK